MNDLIDLIKKDENVSPEFREVVRKDLLLQKCERCGEYITSKNRLLTAEFDNGFQINFGCSKCIERPFEELNWDEFQNKDLPGFKIETNFYRNIIAKEEKKRGNL